MTVTGAREREKEKDSVKEREKASCDCSVSTTAFVQNNGEACFPQQRTGHVTKAHSGGCGIQTFVRGLTTLQTHACHKQTHAHPHTLWNPPQIKRSTLNACQFFHMPPDLTVNCQVASVNCCFFVFRSVT